MQVIANAADSRAIKQAIRDGSLVNPDSICPACQCRIKDHRSGLCYVCRGKQR